MSATAAIAGTRRQRIAAPAYTIGALALVTLALHVRDPHVHGSWGLCPSAALFGVSCPACGGLRAVNDLTDGDVGGAASSNLVFVALLPFLVAGLALWAVGRWRGTPFTVPMRVARPAGYAVLAVLAVFTVLRNLPVGSWLAP